MQRLWPPPGRRLSLLKFRFLDMLREAAFRWRNATPRWPHQGAPMCHIPRWHQGTATERQGPCSPSIQPARGQPRWSKWSPLKESATGFHLDLPLLPGGAAGTWAPGLAVTTDPAKKFCSKGELSQARLSPSGKMY